MISSGSYLRFDLEVLLAFCLASHATLAGVLGWFRGVETDTFERRRRVDTDSFEGVPIGVTHAMMPKIDWK